MTDIEYTVTDGGGLDLTNELWRKLIEHHAEKSRYFSEIISQRTVEQRNRELLEKYKKGDIRIDLAWEKKTGKLAGYCISTISDTKEGEVQSIFVEEEHRGSGIGDAMLEKALEWMAERETAWQVIAVAVGNEEVFPFYRRHGYYPRVTVLTRRDKGK